MNIMMTMLHKEKNMDSVRITRHANKRMKERISGMKSSKRRFGAAQEAYQKGVRYANGTGAQRARILRYYSKNDPNSDRDIALYQGMAYIFSEGILITVLHDDKRPVHNKGYNRAKERSKIQKEFFTA